MAGDAAIGAVTGGGALIPMLVRSFGNGAQEARQKGYSEEQQMALGLANAATEYLSERLFGGNPVYDSDAGLVNKLVGKVVKNPKVMEFLAATPVETLNEGLEEIVSDILNPVAEWAITGNRPEYEVDQIIEDGAVGVLTAMMANGGAAAISRIGSTAKETGSRIIDDPLARAMFGKNVEGEITPQGVEKLNIVDDADPAGYNIIKTEKGAVADGVEQRTQLDRAAGEGVRERLSQPDRRDEGGRTPGQGDIRAAGFLGLSDQAKQTLQQRGVVTVDMEMSADKAAFSRLLDEARAADTKNGWAVTPKSEAELDQCRTFLSADGGVGFAIAPDGDIEAVFRNRNRHEAKMAMKSAIPQALAAGGTKLDCYGEGLVNIYGDCGFEPVARVAFNPEFANPGWTADKGSPDIYVMMATDTDADTVIQKQGSYHYWTDAELEALPLMEYDEAMAYRGSLLARRGISMSEDGKASGTAGE